MQYTQLPAEMHFEDAESRDQDAGSRFLADPAPAPALFQRPFLDRTLPPEHMPEAGPGRRGDAANSLDRPPNRRARRLDPLSRALAVRARSALTQPQVR